MLFRSARPLEVLSLFIESGNSHLLPDSMSKYADKSRERDVNQASATFEAWLHITAHLVQFIVLGRPTFV